MFPEKGGMPELLGTRDHLKGRMGEVWGGRFREKGGANSK